MAAAPRTWGELAVLALDVFAPAARRLIALAGRVLDMLGEREISLVKVEVRGSLRARIPSVRDLVSVRCTTPARAELETAVDGVAVRCSRGFLHHWIAASVEAGALPVNAYIEVEVTRDRHLGDRLIAGPLELIHRSGEVRVYLGTGGSDEHEYDVHACVARGPRGEYCIEAPWGERMCSADPRSMDRPFDPRDAIARTGAEPIKTMDAGRYAVATDAVAAIVDRWGSVYGPAATRCAMALVKVDTLVRALP